MGTRYDAMHRIYKGQHLEKQDMSVQELGTAEDGKGYSVCAGPVLFHFIIFWGRGSFVQFNSMLIEEEPSTD